MTSTSAICSTNVILHESCNLQESNRPENLCGSVQRLFVSQKCLCEQQHSVVLSIRRSGHKPEKATNPLKLSDNGKNSSFRQKIQSYFAPLRLNQRGWDYLFSLLAHRVRHAFTQKVRTFWVNACLSHYLCWLCCNDYNNNNTPLVHLL